MAVNEVEEHIKNCPICLDRAITNYLDILRRLAMSDHIELGSGLTELRCGLVVNLIDK